MSTPLSLVFSALLSLVAAQSLDQLLAQSSDPDHPVIFGSDFVNAVDQQQSQQTSNPNTNQEQAENQSQNDNQQSNTREEAPRFFMPPPQGQFSPFQSYGQVPPPYNMPPPRPPM